ncbi:MAG: nuclear transport factor 2 family protein [Bacteroidota bacterium]
MNLKEKISALEAQLRQALLEADSSTMDQLIHEDLLFVIPDGSTMSKALDLEAYEQGNMTLHNFEVVEMEIRPLGDVALVNLVAKLEGQYQGEKFKGTFRYLRVWKSFSDAWQVVAGSASILSSKDH